MASAQGRQGSLTLHLSLSHDSLVPKKEERGMGGLPKHPLLSKGSGVFAALAMAATARAHWLRSGASRESSLEPLVGRQLRAQRINKCSQSG